MKKLTILVMVMLVATLLTGCWVTPESKLESIEVSHITITIKTDAKITGRLVVTANYEDGTSEEIELTDCEYLSGDLEVAIVDIVGEEVWIRAVGVGDTTILVTYTQHNMWTGRIIKTAEVDVTVE